MPFVMLLRLNSISEAYKKACLDFGGDRHLWCHKCRIGNFKTLAEETHRKDCGYFANVMSVKGSV